MLPPFLPSPPFQLPPRLPLHLHAVGMKVGEETQRPGLFDSLKTAFLFEPEDMLRRRTHTKPEAHGQRFFSYLAYIDAERNTFLTCKPFRGIIGTWLLKQLPGLLGDELPEAPQSSPPQPLSSSGREHCSPINLLIFRGSELQFPYVKC